MQMKARLVVELESEFERTTRREPVVDAKLVLLPSHRHVHRRGIGSQVQGIRIDAVEIHVAVTINKFQILKETIGQMARPIRDLGVDPLTANVVEAKGGCLLIGPAVLVSNSCPKVSVMVPVTVKVTTAAYGAPAGSGALLARLMASRKVVPLPWLASAVPLSSSAVEVTLIRMVRS